MPKQAKLNGTPGKKPPAPSVKRPARSFPTIVEILKDRMSRETDKAKLRDGQRRPPRPMTLGNMRRNGVRGLFVTCQHCVHYAKVNVDAWPDDLAVSFGPRMRCSKCGKLGAMVRSNWTERTFHGEYWPRL